MLLTLYGTVMFIHMSRKIFVPPFRDIDSLVNETKYITIVLNGSVGDMLFQVAYIHYDTIIPFYID